MFRLKASAFPSHQRFSCHYTVWKHTKTMKHLLWFRLVNRESLLSPFPLPLDATVRSSTHKRSFINQSQTDYIGSLRWTINDELFCWWIWPIIVSWLSHALFSLSLPTSVCWSLARVVNTPNQHPACLRLASSVYLYCYWMVQGTRQSNSFNLCTTTSNSLHLTFK